MSRSADLPPLWDRPVYVPDRPKGVRQRSRISTARLVRLRRKPTAEESICDRQEPFSRLLAFHGEDVGPTRFHPNIRSRNRTGHRKREIHGHDRIPVAMHEEHFPGKRSELSVKDVEGVGPLVAE